MSEEPYTQPVMEETLDETDAKCPNCAATVSFDPATGMLTCPYCGYSRQVSSDEETAVEELDLEQAENGESSFAWGEDKKTVICEQCGGESVYDALAVSNVCPYCGSNHVMEAATETSIAPNAVCPFKVPKQTAMERFSKWLKGRWFAPSSAKKQAKAEQAQGVFLPFWTFDTQTTSHYTARAGRDRWVGSGEKRRRVTHWFSVSGIYQQSIDDQPVEATQRYDRGLILKLGAYDTAHAVPYRSEYLAGFISERYSVGLNDGWQIAKTRIRARLEGEVQQYIRRHNRADHVASLRMNTVYDNVRYKYIMLPVWMSSFTYKGKVYRFMVNGETGRVAGHFPVSAWRVLVAVVLGATAVSLLWYWFNGGM